MVLCSGRVYFDLMEERLRAGRTASRSCASKALSFPGERADPGAEPLSPKAELVWCQEEPQNQGAWNFIKPRIDATVAKLGGKASPRYAGRPEYASTAAGMMKQHLAELAQFLNDALSL